MREQSATEASEAHAFAGPALELGSAVLAGTAHPVSGCGCRCRC